MLITANRSFIQIYASKKVNSNFSKTISMLFDKLKNLSKNVTDVLARYKEKLYGYKFVYIKILAIDYK